MHYMETELEVKIPNKALEIDWRFVKNELVRIERISSARNAGAREGVFESVDECIETARSAVAPKIASSVKKITGAGPDFIETEDYRLQCGRKLAAYIKGATSIHLFVITLGEQLESMASKLMKEGEGLKGYLLDRIGSIAVESIASSVEKYLRECYLKKDASVSMRISPGYCNWPVEEQFKFAKLVNFSEAGVSLTKSCMMVPIKSISAITAISPKGLFAEIKSPCDICGKGDCDYRRE